jgi:hypothetical protein
LLPAALLLMAGNGYLMLFAEPVRGTQISNAAPFANVVFMLVSISAANGLVRHWFPRFALRSVELIALYGMLSIQSALCSGRYIHWLLYSITYGYWFERLPELAVRLPAWLTVQDREALRGFYLGNSTLFTEPHLRAWLPPIAAWTLFFYALGGVFTAVALLFARQWAFRERLTYPVAELPLRVTSESSALWRNRLAWAGIALGAGVELLNGLSYWCPSIPSFPTRRMNLARQFTTKPWSAIEELNLSFYPFIAGLGFLMPVDLSFSAVFFMFLDKGQEVAGAVTGLDGVPGYPFSREQQFGGVTVLFVGLIWSGRRHLEQALRLACGLPGRHRQEHLLTASQCRGALVAIVGGTAFLAGFLTLAGLDGWVAAAVVTAHLGVALAVARIRADLGFPSHPLFGINGTSLLMIGVGGEFLGPRNLPLMAVLNSFTMYHSNHMLPYQIETFRLADRTGTPYRSIVGAMLLALVVAVPATFIIHVAALYHLGGSAKASWGLHLGRHTWDQVLAPWLQGQAGGLYRLPQWTSLGVVVGTAGASLSLLALRQRCHWFLLHPVGIVLTNAMNDVWLAVFAAMTAKWVVLRYLGLRGYRAAIPFCLGLMVGDMTMGMSWIAIGVLLDRPGYVFFL